MLTLLRKSSHRRALRCVLATVICVAYFGMIYREFDFLGACYSTGHRPCGPQLLAFARVFTSVSMLIIYNTASFSGILLRPVSILVMSLMALFSVLEAITLLPVLTSENYTLYALTWCARLFVFYVVAANLADFNAEQ